MRKTRKLGLISAALALVAVIAACAQQPLPPTLNRFMVLFNDQPGYIAVPHSPDLELPFALTIEGWVRFEVVDEECVSLVGKDWLDAYWVGWCEGVFRSHMGGQETEFDAGAFTQGEWTHFAVTSSSSGRTHYLNGEFVGSTPLPHATGTGEAELRIGSDVQWEHTPSAALDEIRIWNRALTPAEIRSFMSTKIVQAQPGLVAVWALEFDGSDALGVHDGELAGTPAFGQDGTVTSAYPTMPVVYIDTPDCAGQGEEPVYYVAIPFDVAATGTYRVSLKSWQGSGSFYIYEGSFDATDGAQNCVAGNNDPVDGRSTLDVALTAGGPHHIVVINDDTMPGTSVEFTISVAAL